MPRTTIKNLIIFGDSMSDIGTKADSGMGAFANFFGLMQVNEQGRFSDRKNWTDFFWEWAGGTSLFRPGVVRFNDPDAPPRRSPLPPTSPLIETRAATLVHRTLTVDSSQDSGSGRTHPGDSSSGHGRAFTYVNYAEGGAMGASDHSKIGLGTFQQQYERFRTQAHALPLEGDTMFIIWFGLNDLVTNNRDPDTMHKVVEEMFKIIGNLNAIVGARAHFMLINLPDPADAVRYAALRRDSDQMVRFTKGATHFNAELAKTANDSWYLNVRVVDMFAVLKAVTHSAEALARNGLVRGAQAALPPMEYPHIGPLPVYAPRPAAPAAAFRIPPPPPPARTRVRAPRPAALHTPHPPAGPPPPASPP
ncbi:hypothetical protein D7X74_35960, partial [Corallococcus sp. CA047B]